MNWEEVRKSFPEQWLIIEALEAHTTSDNQRHLDRVAVVESCKDGAEALMRYRVLHLKEPQRELYYVHTSRVELDIREQKWMGLKGIFAMKNNYLIMR
jgi:hypothetical protein